jgi:regulator of protease activity HflC (stomatin/prohibitin superfamily)
MYDQMVMTITAWIIVAAAAIVVIYLFAGVRVVRPTSRGLVERFGKYRRVAEPGFHWIVPIADRLFLVNVTEGW